MTRLTLSGGILIRAQSHAHFPQAFAIEKLQHDGVTVGLIQSRHRRVQQRSNLHPDTGFVFIQNGLHAGLLFAADPPDSAG